MGEMAVGWWKVVNLVIGYGVVILERGKLFG